MKAEITNNALLSWERLNDALRDADVATCNMLLKEELDGRRRRKFISRIHSRLNKARADAEREELGLK